MSRTIVITGANRGLGLGLAEHYAKEGDRVIGVVRSSSAELDALADKVVAGVELTAPDGPARVANALKGVDIDILLNVAGVMEWEEIDEVNAEQVRRQFEINALAPLLLTHALLPHLKNGSKVAFWTSRLGSMTDNTSGKGYGYRMSKAALNMAAKTLSIDLAPRGVSVGLLHPGSVKTSLNRLGGEIEVAESIRGLVARIAEIGPETTGRYVHQNGTPLPW